MLSAFLEPAPLIRLLPEALSSHVLTPSSAFAADYRQFEQRNIYRKAMEQLRRGQTARFKQADKALRGYILYPYLEYQALRNRIAYVNADEMQDFVARNAELPVTSLLERRWLKRLGRDRKWGTLLANRIETQDTELRCYQLRAQYNAGNRQLALAQTADLWVQPFSLPKACDPLFGVWLETSYFNEALAWQRLAGALLANEVSLAKYLSRYFSGPRKVAADAFYQAHITPGRLENEQIYHRNEPLYREIVLQVLPRLAKRNPEKARKLLPRLTAVLQLNGRETQLVHEAIFRAFAEEGEFPQPDQRKPLAGSSITVDLANAAVEQQRWQEASAWIELMPTETRQQTQWQYWLARALTEQMGPNEHAELAFKSLANQRHYYGFLAAHKLGVNGKLNAARANINPLSLTRFANQAAVRRALELFAVGDDLNGRREWFRILNNASQENQLLAAELALKHGNLRLAIASANQAEALDHLHLRFPVIFQPQFRQASLRTNLPLPTMLSIARQESAMDHVARSSAGARGLMQLMPATARLVAQRAGLRSPATQALYDPGTNIELGSYHLAWLKTRYEGQTPLAIAAYNAGEHRVDRWIREAQNMPTDVWIETIPFRETRNYVKNVLAFRHVYAQRLGTPLPFLTTREAQIDNPNK